MTFVMESLSSGAVAIDVMACGYATADAIAARRTIRLGQLLNAAFKGSPFYRERLHGFSIDTAPLSSLQSVSRGELMQRFDDWVTDPALKLSELRAFTADPRRIGELYLDKYLIWESSGTSNEPGIFVQDAPALAVFDALESFRRSEPRLLQRWFDPLFLTERIAFVGAIGGHFSSVVSMQRLRKINPFMGQ